VPKGVEGMNYNPERTKTLLDQIRMNLIKKGFTSKTATFFARKWTIRK